jgi:hypothetical protein
MLEMPLLHDEAADISTTKLTTPAAGRSHMDFPVNFLDQSIELFGNQEKLRFGAYNESNHQVTSYGANLNQKSFVNPVPV